MYDDDGYEREGKKTAPQYFRPIKCKRLNVSHINATKDFQKEKDSFAASRPSAYVRDNKNCENKETETEMASCKGASVMCTSKMEILLC